jgi:hypothetical protein
MRRSLLAIPPLLALMLAGCTTEGVVLVSTDAGGDAEPPFTDCELALALGTEGAPCRDFTRCTRFTDVCCLIVASCEGGVLRRSPPVCEDGCRPCVFDRDCPSREFCEGGRCTACPAPEPPDGCPPCPEGTMLNVRNDCSTCACTPPSACRTDADCGPGLACYPGQVCTGDCRSRGDLSCCANACGAPDVCPFPAPVGCRTACPPELPCPTGCYATGCRCDGSTMGWECALTCLPEGFEAGCAF